MSPGSFNASIRSPAAGIGKRRLSRVARWRQSFSECGYVIGASSNICSVSVMSYPSQTDGDTHRQTDGRTDGQTERQTDGRWQLDYRVVKGTAGLKTDNLSTRLIWFYRPVSFISLGQSLSLPVSLFSVCLSVCLSVLTECRTFPLDIPPPEQIPPQLGYSRGC